LAHTHHLPPPTTPPTTNTPTYPFQHHTYWLADEARADAAGLGLVADPHPLLGARLNLPDDGLVLTGRIGLKTQPWLADHALGGVRLVPGSAFFDLALHAGSLTGAPHVQELTLQQPLVLPDRAASDIQVATTRTDDPDEWTIAIRSRDGDEWTEHATGVLTATPPMPSGGAAEWPPPGATSLSVVDFYLDREQLGYEYGPVFQGLTQAWRTGTGVAAEITLPADLDVTGTHLHPALLDAALHTIHLLRDDSAGTPRHAPYTWAGSVHRDPDAPTVLRVTATPASEPDRYTIALATPSSPEPVATLSVTTRPVATEASGALRNALFELTWVPLPATNVPAVGWTGLVLDENSDGEPESVLRVTTEVLSRLRAHRDADSDLGPLVVITRGAMASHPDEAVTSLAAAAAWGLVRSAQTESPGQFCLADIDGSPDDPQVRAAVEAAVAAGEGQLLVRGGQALVPRLARLTADPQGDDDGAIWDPEGTVLITGGTGSLGSLTARHLASHHGVRHLLLVGRRGPDAPGADALREELAGLGAEAAIVACDVADEAQLRALLTQHLAGRRLAGVVHTAGVLDDAMVTSLTSERLAGVLRAKVDAAWHLHRLTTELGLDPDLFVLFSSVAGTAGTMGQGNYAAANAALDGLAGLRHSQGLPAVSLAWGRWAEPSGMTAGLDATDRAQLDRIGLVPMPVQQGLALLDAALAYRRTHPVLVTARLDLAALRRRADEDPRPTIFSGLLPTTRAGSRTRTGLSPDSLAEELGALTDEERRARIHALIIAEVAGVLAHSPDTIQAGRSFKELGFDSMTAIELRNRLHSRTGLRLPATLIFDHANPDALAEHLATALAPRTPAAAAGLLDQIEGLEKLLAALSPEHLTSAVPDDTRRDEITARLRDLSSAWASMQPVPAVSEGIDAVSDDDLLDFLDNKFGVTGGADQLRQDG
ncbi:type I polyketide synthase, partial [Micromonospora lupini]|uniref:type I polyketide synthase n=1 Tax=Micromonospora lupini TaxID=285679 RepID=UPI0033C9A964